jgi:pyruvate kinase|tara:strand:- start:293 stop:1240 length:948 start_codon:yes stop_codon:yes gene_type:complete
MKKEIFCTVGPGSLNKSFLNFSRKNINLLRLNMSHVDIKNLPKTINFIRKYTSTPICIDTEGAQIRSKVIKNMTYKKNLKLNIFLKKGNFKLYPPEVFYNLKKNDILDVGFEGLKIKIVKIVKEQIKCIVIEPGKLENNKGIHVVNRKFKLNFITKKDQEAIEIGKKNKIKYFALSFVNSSDDIKKFNKILKTEKKIFKIETENAMKNIDSILKSGDNFLIDRGDLSKEIKIENIPLAQRLILKKAKKFNKKVYIATNFLESMIYKNFPTRAEVNDIYNAIELGSAGIVLAAETAIGKYPIECVNLIKKIFRIFK